VKSMQDKLDFPPSKTIRQLRQRCRSRRLCGHFLRWDTPQI